MLWAVLQFALPAAASTADAHQERESRAQLAHVESTSTSSCRPAHAAACAFCQILSQSFAQPAGSPPPAIVAALPCPAATESLSPASASRGRLPLARAPPTA